MKIYKDVDLETVPISPNIIKFDRMELGRSIMEYLPLFIQIQIYDIVKSLKYSGTSEKIKAKKALIDQLVQPYGFVRLGCGTNRLVYSCVYDNRIVLKIPFEESGLSDGYNEMTIQEYLKPFICKTFEVGYMGICSLHERVIPIEHKAQFDKVSDMHFELIFILKRNGYMLDDVGIRTFKNVGIRENFGLVILDYPTVYQINKQGGLLCKRCGGRIDYDAGFNRISCKSCKKIYTTQSLASGKLQSYESIIAQNKISGGKGKMKLKIVNPLTNEVILETEGEKETKKIEKKNDNKKAPNPFKKSSERLNLKITYPEGTMLQRDPIAIKSKNNPGQKRWETKEVMITEKMAKDMGVSIYHEPIVEKPKEEEKQVDQDEEDFDIPTPNGVISSKQLENINIPDDEENNEAEQLSFDLDADEDYDISEDYLMPPKQMSKKKFNKRRKKDDYNYNVEDF